MRPTYFALIILSFCSFFGSLQGQTITMTGTNGVSNTNTGCSGTFVDAGGAGGAYPSTVGAFQQVFCPATANDIVHLDFASINLVQGGAGSNDDDIRIYSGVGTGGPLLFDAPADFSCTDCDFYGAVGQCITVLFIQAGSNNGPAAGWTASVGCINTTTTPVFTGSTINTCNGLFTDPGGLTGYQDGSIAAAGSIGYYTNNAGNYYSICPCTPGTYATLSWSDLDMAAGDEVTVLDGGLSGGIIGTFSGTSLPPTITSSSPDGCLTVVFSSNSSTVAPGWVASVGNSTVPGINTYCCATNNCSGGCGVWICSSAEFNPDAGIGQGCAEDMRTSSTIGCQGTGGEVNSNWYYFSPETSGTLNFVINLPTGLDIDYSIFLSPTDGSIACPLNTNQAPLRCSFAARNGAGTTGLSAAALDLAEGSAGDGFTAEMNVLAGQTYSMLINVFSPGNPQAGPTITWGGTATLSCTPDGGVLASQQNTFYGRRAENGFELNWTADLAKNNEVFNILRGTDPNQLEPIGSVFANDMGVSYKYMDNNLQGGTYYYQVVGVNTRGETDKTRVIQLYYDNADQHAKLVKIVNLMGTEVTQNPPKGQVLIKVYDNGYSEKYIVLD